MARRLVEALQTRHEKHDFDCGNRELNEFLRSLARQYDRRNFARTFVAVEEGSNRVDAYFTVSAGSIDLSALPDQVRRRAPKHPVPVLHLGRLAVDLRCRGRRLGEGLLIEALRLAVDLSRTIGVFAVEVVAADDSAAAFYRKYGFTCLTDDPYHLYLPIHMAQQLLKNESS